MPELLMFCVSDKVSGGERFTLQLLAAMNSLGWETRLVGRADSGLEEAAALAGVRFTGSSRLGPKLGKRTVFRTLWTWSAQRREFLRLLDEYPDAYVILQYKLEQLMWAVSRRDRPCFYLEHGPIPQLIRLPLVRALYRKGLRRSAGTFAASHPATLALREMGGSPVFVAAGMNEERRQDALGARAEKRRMLEAEISAQTIGVYAGRITADKGVLDAAKLCLEAPGVGLAIYGDGPEVGRLKAVVNGSDRVRYMGVVADVLPAMAAADFTILFTRDPGEGRPLSVIESLSVGTPVIGSSASAAMVGVRDEFGAASVQLLQSTSAQEFADALVRLPRAISPEVPSWAGAAVAVSEALMRGKSEWV